MEKLTKQAILDIQAKVADIIRKTYNCEFTGIIKVIQLNNGYEVKLFKNKEILLFDVAADIEDLESFLKYFTEELKRSRLNLIKFYTGYKYEETDYMAKNQQTC